MTLTTLDPVSLVGLDRRASGPDRLLDRFLDNWTTSTEAQATAHGGRSLRRDDVAAADLGRPADFTNIATLLAPLEPERMDGSMAVLDDFYGFSDGATTGAVYLFSPWPTPDLHGTGWERLGQPPLMLRPAGGEAPPPPRGLRIEEVRDAAVLRAFESVIVRGFSPSEDEAHVETGRLNRAILADDRRRMWVGWEGDTPVSAAETFTATGVNDVTLVATAPEARRQGYGSALTWRATLADPTLPSLLLASDEGRPVYERIGYRATVQFTLWRRERPAGRGVQATSATLDPAA